MKCFECELDFKICAQCGVDPTTCTIFKRKRKTMTCKDCYYGAKYLYPDDGSYYCGLIDSKVKNIENCRVFREKKMSDKIEIDVRVNGKAAKLSDISDETLANIKKSEFKPIEHGDYGTYISDWKEEEYRLFVLIEGRIKAFSKEGRCMNNSMSISPGINAKYTINGNIFKDLQNA